MSFLFTSLKLKDMHRNEGVLRRKTSKFIRGPEGAGEGEGFEK